MRFNRLERVSNVEGAGNRLCHQSLSMRIRVLGEPQFGLPQVKSWFNVEQDCTVASLKSSLCASISALREARVQAIELVLLLDDFELLDNTAVHILRDGDLVWYVE